MFRRLRRPRRGGAIVLCYHRIADVTTDPQLLCVRPDHFAEQLELIRERYEPMPLAELVAAARESTAPERAVAVTFDDGYVDTLVAAKPLLERAGVHATVFVATGYVRDGRTFWWDELERLLLRPGRLPPVLSVPLDGRRLQFDLSDDAAYTAASAASRSGWTVLDAGEPGPRQRIYRELTSRLRLLTDDERERALRHVRSVAEPQASAQEREPPRALTLEELRRLADDEIVDIGAHTVTHPVLSQLPPEEQQVEIDASKRELEDAVAKPVSSFAYPYGEPAAFDETTVSLVRRAAFDHACSTVPGRLDGHTDAFRVPRVLVRDWSGDALDRRLSRQP
jgi:peptidoglycan/xylan/chitin deacetylase (PgdA/CDA1 family)